MAKMIEACFLESDVADLEARRAVYESIYVVTVRVGAGFKLHVEGTA